MLVKPHLRNEVETMSAEYVLGMSLVPSHRTLSVVQLQAAGHFHLGGRFGRLVQLKGKREKNTRVQSDRRRNGPIGLESTKKFGKLLRTSAALNVSYSQTHPSFLKSVVVGRWGLLPVSSFISGHISDLVDFSDIGHLHIHVTPLSWFLSSGFLAKIIFHSQ